jgi:predicted transcriptional regulator
MRLKKFNFYLLIKALLIISSFTLLSIILSQLITSKLDYFGFERIYTIELVIISLLITFLFLISIFEVLTLKEYKGYIIRRPQIKKGRSYLSLTDIFENENRLNILREILNNPGIHQNELLRNCDLQKGQLQWHLDVLLKNRIIKKEKYGQYTIYFPITSSIESIEKFKNLPVKSETTNKVFELIQKNPGISSSEISKKINLARNTVKYHIDKLSENNLITLKGKGRKIELYPKVGSFDN